MIERVDGFPEHNDPNRELFLFYALLFNVNEMYAAAKKQDAANIEAMKAMNRTTYQRYLLIEHPRRNQPLERQVVPTRVERMLLLPDPYDHPFIDRVIVRLPAPMSQPNKEESLDLRNAFIEAVSTDGGRARFLLNSGGLWRYDNAADIFSTRDGEYHVTGGNPESGETMEYFSRLIGESSFGFQTRFDSHEG